MGVLLFIWPLWLVSLAGLIIFTASVQIPPSLWERDLRKETEPNLKPVIGILSQETTKEQHYTSFIPANYVKFCETGGARVVPIMINKSEDYYRGIFNAINGVVFPGGSVPFSSPQSGYGRAGSILYDLILEAKEKRNEEIPLMGTCMGFQFLLYLDANRINPLSSCHAFDIADRLYFKTDYNETWLLGDAPKDVIQTLINTNSTSNFHHYCVTPQKFAELGLNKNLTLISTSLDVEGVEYVSTVEHKRLPVFGTQWHPEKNMFEWAYQSVPHSLQAIKAVQYIANTFVEKARLNSHRYHPADAANYPLIYNYQPIYDNEHLIYLFK